MDALKTREVKMNPVEFSQARERGRSLAAQALLMHPEKRLELENLYGEAKCRIQYPEAYGLDETPRIVLP